MAEALIGLIGVLIGAVITALFTWFLDELRSDREQKIYITHKREETYLKALDCLISVSADHQLIMTGNPTNEVKEKINSTISYINLYASDKISKNYLALQKELQNSPNKKTYLKMEKLIKDIKKELKIE